MLTNSSQSRTREFPDADNRWQTLFIELDLISALYATKTKVRKIQSDVQVTLTPRSGLRSQRVRLITVSAPLRGRGQK